MPPSILITLYNCHPESSETIKAILNTKANLSGSLLCIWNNGPQSIEIPHEIIHKLSEKGIKARFLETPQNAPLSWIYNTFLKKFGSEHNIILDHDSILSEEYLSHIALQTTNFIGMPIIKSKGLPQYPLSKGIFSAGPYKKETFVASIGSGIIISKQAAENVRTAYGNTFDENFALYGVDTSFFIRIYKLGLNDKLQSAPGFEHSLSRLEAEAESIKEFRKVERSYDFGLMLRHYPSFSLLKELTKQLILRAINKNTLIIIESLSILITGHHKRCSSHHRKEFFEILGKQNHYEQY